MSLANRTAWLSLVVLLGCGSRDAAAPAPTVPSPTPGAPDRVFHMQRSFWTALHARDALIDGDLDQARRSAKVLAKEDFGKAFPASWNHWVAQMQQAADDLALAGTLDEASASLGAIGVACGNCHWAHRAGPGDARETPIPWDDPPDGVVERMQRHQSGAEQMWAGLIVPSEDDWRTGTRTLTRAPLEAPERDGRPIGSEAHAQIGRIRDIATRARTASTYEARGEIYGELISTCAHCHFGGPRTN